MCIQSRDYDFFRQKSISFYRWTNVLLKTNLHYCSLKGTLWLTRLSLASPKRDIGKQCKPRSDAAERGVWSGSTLFALNTGISLKHGINKN